MRNPYNCTVPGNCFVGYSALREHILNNLQNKHSYAIIGGRRCGKTSMLMQIEKDLEKAAEHDPGILARRFSVNGLGAVSPAILFGEIFRLIVRNIDVGTSQHGYPKYEADYKSGYEYQIFLENPDKAFYLISNSQICTDMKKTTLETLVRTMEFRENIVTVPEEIRLKAKQAVERMLAI